MGNQGGATGVEVTVRAAQVLLLSLTASAAELRVSASGPHPLDEAIRILAVRHLWPLCYEEAPWPGAYDPEFVAVVYNPAEGPEAALRGLVKAYGDLGGGARYDVIWFGQRWCAVIREYRDAQGKWKPVRSPLGLPVSLERRMYSYGLLIEEISRQLKRQGGAGIFDGCGMAPGSGYPVVEAYAEAETARAVVDRLNQGRRFGPGPRPKLVNWHLICGTHGSCRLDTFLPVPLIPPPPFVPPRLPDLTRPALPELQRRAVR